MLKNECEPAVGQGKSVLHWSIQYVNREKSLSLYLEDWVMTFFIQNDESKKKDILDDKC